MYAYRAKSKGHTMKINSSPFSVLCRSHLLRSPSQLLLLPVSLSSQRYSLDFYLYQTIPSYLLISPTIHLVSFHKMVAYYTHFLWHLVFSHTCVIIRLHTVFPYGSTHRDASLLLRVVNHFIEWIYPNLLAHLILKEIQFASDICNYMQGYNVYPYI